MCGGCGEGACVKAKPSLAREGCQQQTGQSDAALGINSQRRCEQLPEALAAGGRRADPPRGGWRQRRGCQTARRWWGPPLSPRCTVPAQLHSASLRVRVSHRRGAGEGSAAGSARAAAARGVPTAMAHAALRCRASPLNAELPLFFSSSAVDSVCGLILRGSSLTVTVQVAGAASCAAAGMAAMEITPQGAQAGRGLHFLMCGPPQQVFSKDASPGALRLPTPPHPPRCCTRARPRSPSPPAAQLPIMVRGPLSQALQRQAGTRKCSARCSRGRGTGTGACGAVVGRHRHAPEGLSVPASPPPPPLNSSSTRLPPHRRPAATSVRSTACAR